MKEDILEQLVDEYLMHKGYFTMHNVKFKPSTDDVDFVSNQDSVASDIDVIAIHPRKVGEDRVIVVSCKSWQEGFDPDACLHNIAHNKKYAGREAWRGFRELCSPKWSRAFLDAVEAATGSRSFTYWTAVTSVRKKRSTEVWENHAPFRTALEGNPIRLVSFADMLDDVWAQLSTTPAATELGRMIQLMKASRWLGSAPRRRDSLAASNRQWPAITYPSSSTRIGLVHPNSLMLFATSSICWRLCVFGLEA